MALVALPSARESAAREPDRHTRAAVIAWILAGVFLLLCAGPTPVTRTQEARVLETAREMIGQPWQDWVVPHTNGEIRLRKPPLAYWLSAISFNVFGVSAHAGRVPAALEGWATLGFVYLIARRLFNSVVARYATAVLLGSYLFFKHALLAETDILGTLFITAGIYVVLRLFQPRASWLWQHALALCVALAILSKGPNAGFILIFYVLACAIHRDWRPLGRFFTRGAIITLIVVAVPWFAYVLLKSDGHQLSVDLFNSAGGGEGHHGPLLGYIPLLAAALSPWTLTAAVATAVAVYQLFDGIGLPIAYPKAIVRHRRRLQTFRRRLIAKRPENVMPLAILTCWSVAIIVPLSLWGNKQIHYLLPLMPVAAITIGWALYRTRVYPSARATPWIQASTWAIVVALPIAVVAIPLGAERVRHHVRPIDMVLIATCAAGFVFLICVLRKRPTWFIPTVLGAGIIVAPLASLWTESLSKTSPQKIVTVLSAECPGAHFVFRNGEHLPTCFALRRLVPVLDDAGLKNMAADSKLVVLERLPTKETATVPPGFHEAMTVKDGANRLDVYLPQHSTFKPEYTK